MYQLKLHACEWKILLHGALWQDVSGSWKREQILCLICGIFISLLEDFCWGYKATEDVNGEPSPLHGRQEIPKMFFSVLLSSPEEKVIFPFSVPIIFLEPSLYGTHKHQNVAANHHVWKKPIKSHPANNAEKWVLGTFEWTNFMMVFVASDIFGLTVVQQTIWWMKSECYQESPLSRLQIF